jgi:D-alanyl-D-alanine carboxypeptidase
MRRIWVAITVAAGMAWAGAAGAQTAEDGLAAMRARLEAVEGYSGIYGLVRAGETAIEATEGYAPDQAWRWASVTKMITAILVLQQVDAGRVALDAPIATYLPDFPTNADSITVRQLLTHTSGLADLSATPDADRDGMPDIYQGAGDWRAICRGPARAEPGTGFAYTNCDYRVLGEILEAVSGRSYADLLDEGIVRPLGLGPIGVPVGQRSEARADGRAEPVIDPAAYGPAGGLYGRAVDLLKIDQALMEGGLISSASRAEMWKGEPSAGFAALSVWSYSPDLGACLGRTRLVERYGAIGGVHVRNFLLPDIGVALTVYSSDGQTAFGEVWQGQGLSVDLIRAAACGAS